MKLNIYTIKDQKAIYSRPMFGHNVGTVLRSFTDMANDKQHPIGQHPEDYFLFEVGTFDEETAEIITHDPIISLGRALDFVTQPEAKKVPQMMTEEQIINAKKK